MLELILARPDGVAAPEDAPAVPDDAQVWCDWSGIPRAFGFTCDGHNWIRLPGVASFRFPPGGGWVEALAPEGAAREDIREAFQRHVLPFALQALGHELLHSSAVSTPRGAIGFCGSSGAGKSTLAYALGRRGYAPLADDALQFERVDGALHLIRLPFAIHISNASLLDGGQAGGPKSAVPGSENEGDPVPLAGLFVVERLPEDSERGHEVVPLPHASAFPLLLYHAHCFSFREDARTRQMIERYLALAAEVPTFLIRYRPDFALLPAILDAVEQALA
ncbi:MAG: hypothetical protein ACR2KP_05440 [Egibacteraceae bacterium]